MRNECTDKVTKFGGAARRRFHAICEKPEGGAQADNGEGTAQKPLVQAGQHGAG